MADQVAKLSKSVQHRLDTTSDDINNNVPITYSLSDLVHGSLSDITDGFKQVGANTGVSAGVASENAKIQLQDIVTQGLDSIRDILHHAIDQTADSAKSHIKRDTVETVSGDITDVQAAVGDAASTLVKAVEDYINKTFDNAQVHTGIDIGNDTASKVISVLKDVESALGSVAKKVAEGVEGGLNDSQPDVAVKLQQAQKDIGALADKLKNIFGLNTV